MHDKKTVLLYVIISLITIALVTLGVLSYFNFNAEVEVVDFSEYTTNEIEKWSKDNDVKYELEYQFDDVIEKGKVVSQSVKANQMIKSKD
ncbi:MAG: PASTA domain-containing protein, partial [Erysipelotrichaceae bacterium]|nr:PASTA domain-containing protein [Erysipelotrichaceae bacterium]